MGSDKTHPEHLKELSFISEESGQYLRPYMPYKIGHSFHTSATHLENDHPGNADTGMNQVVGSSLMAQFFLCDESVTGGADIRTASVMTC